jgi:LPXTG-motif cell wall-anchored protein
MNCSGILHVVYGQHVPCLAHGPSTLPFTGFDSLWVLVAGLALIVLGLLLRKA